MQKDILSIFGNKYRIVKTSEILKKGYTNYQIKKMVDQGIIESIKKGYYKLANQEISDIRIVTTILPSAVICFDTALFYYGYSDRVPLEIHIAVDKDISKSKVKFDYPFVKPYFVEPYLLSIGVERVKFGDVDVNIYSRDRLICDCLLYENRMEIEILNKAIINYINDPKKNISKLMEFARTRGIEKKIYNKIGIWL